MDLSTIKTFSQAVIAGLAIRGISSDGLQLLMATPKTRMSRIVAGKANLSSREIYRIESMTGLTAGQLAASVTEPEGGPLTELFKSTAVLLKLERAMEAREQAKLKRLRSRAQSRKTGSKQANSSRRSEPSRSKRSTQHRALAVA